MTVLLVIFLDCSLELAIKIVIRWLNGDFGSHFVGLEQMAKDRTYSRYTKEAAALLSRQIKLGRKERKWTESELAGRAGISRATLQKIEKGDLNVAIGLTFEVATLVGVTLFSDERSSLARHLARADETLALLPGAVRKPRKVTVDDDF